MKDPASVVATLLIMSMFFILFAMAYEIIMLKASDFPGKPRTTMWVLAIIFSLNLSTFLVVARFLV